MPIERASGGSSLIDVLDRVLDKGIDLITVEARVVVAAENQTLRATLGSNTLQPAIRRRRAV
jgi:hypothetical protein